MISTIIVQNIPPAELIILVVELTAPAAPATPHTVFPCASCDVGRSEYHVGFHLKVNVTHQKLTSLTVIYLSHEGKSFLTILFASFHIIFAI